MAQNRRIEQLVSSYVYIGAVPNVILVWVSYAGHPINSMSPAGSSKISVQRERSNGRCYNGQFL